MNTLFDLSLLCFIIPFQYDSPDRLANLKTILDYLSVFFKHYQVIILERGFDQKAAHLASESVLYVPLGDTPFFHRTAYFNQGARLTHRPFIACYDTDVVFHPNAIIEAMAILKNSCTPFVFPHNGVCWDIRPPLRTRFSLSFDFDQLKTPVHFKVGKVYGAMHCLHKKSLGGATFFNREVFLQAGGYNSEFISWGWEDNEIVDRFTKLGWAPVRVANHPCFHLHHHRGIDSSDAHAHFKQNFETFKKVYRLFPDELGDYIQSILGGSLSVNQIRMLGKKSPKLKLLRQLISIFKRIQV